MSEKRLPRVAISSMCGSWRLAALLSLALGLLLSSSLPAQEPKAAAPAKSADDDKNEIPEPVELKGAALLTKDGVSLEATYYPSNQGKKAVPVVLLHSFKTGDRKEFVDLGLYLQNQGYAVLSPDLRGHGGSTTQIADGVMYKIDAKKLLPPSEFVNMYTQDMEAIRSFLVKENDDGKLNLNALAIVGSEMGASVAVYFTGYNNCALARVEPDVRRMPSPDVKGLVLISPAVNNPPTLSIIKGLGTYPALKSDLPMLILVGDGDRKALADAERIRKLIKPFHPDPDPQDETQKQIFFYGTLTTKLEGAKLFAAPELRAQINDYIARFLKKCVVEQSYPWRVRRMPAN
jgi:pimeloyl-ACP methyl ester carboxylesterase